jgi:hypothetical protein
METLPCQDFRLEATLAHVDIPLDGVQAFGLLGGTAIYLLAHVAFSATHAPSTSNVSPSPYCCSGLLQRR